MKRTIEQWTDYDPTKAINIQSRSALRITLEDARADILELHAEVEQLQGMLTDMATAVEIIAGDLHVDTEPHQTFLDRLMQAARETGEPAE